MTPKTAEQLIAEKIVNASKMWNDNFGSVDDHCIALIEQALLSYYKERLLREWPSDDEIELNTSCEDRDASGWLKQRLIGEMK